MIELQVGVVGKRVFPAAIGRVGSKRRIKPKVLTRATEPTNGGPNYVILPPTPNVTYSAGLLPQAERMFVTGRALYPIERTLLTTGLVAAGVQSLATGQKRIETPHLAVPYRAPCESTFLRS